MDELSCLVRVLHLVYNYRERYLHAFPSLEPPAIMTAQLAWWKDHWSFPGGTTTYRDWLLLGRQFCLLCHNGNGFRLVAAPPPTSGKG